MYCYGNACHGLSVTCIHGPCAFNAFCTYAEYDEYICPDGYKLSPFMGDIYLPDISNISQIYNDCETGLQDCSKGTTAQCNDYQGCAGRELKNNSVCCSAAQGCENAVSIVPDVKNHTFIRCDCSDACHNIAVGK